MAQIQINMPVIGTLVRFWRTLFTPFKGWDIGCDYCGCQAESIRLCKCGRGKAFGWVGCGVTDSLQAQDAAKLSDGGVEVKE